METFAGIGRSEARDPMTAGHDAALAACGGLGGSADLCLVFATSGYDQTGVLAGVAQVAHGARIAGCSGEGVIAGPVSDESEHAVAVMAIRSETLGFETFMIEGYADDPRAAGARLGAQVRSAARGDEIGLLVFPDGLVGNCTDFLAALDPSLPAGLPVAGGTAADALLLERTWQYHDTRAVSEAVAAVLMRGRGRLEIAVSHGCSAIGLERTITRAGGGWLHEIDGRPAWSVFKEYLDGDPQDLNVEGIPRICIGQPLPDLVAHEYEPFIIRAPLDLDRDTGALFFPGGGLVSGAAVRLTRRDPIQVRRSAEACAERIRGRSTAAGPAFVLQFDCAGRGRVLFGSCAADEIVEPLQRVLGRSTPWVGFHTYGEIAPIADRTYYHNYTVALCAVFEGDGRP